MNHSPSHTATSPSLASTPQPANAPTRERDGQWLLIAGGVLYSLYKTRDQASPAPSKA